ncbi:uncharacterized protein E23 isoform X2 [Eurosta solidaginis]|uniref:uncharacterized protein E23 isoform X2 n=1 Tax=Eurosta solidaginis TaxID=178769 RepID=UPI00353088A5
MPDLKIINCMSVSDTIIDTISVKVVARTNRKSVIMIISKDLFIFGEHIFATIIPESGTSQIAQQQQQQQPATQQQQQLESIQEQPQQLAIISAATITTITTDIDELATQIKSAVNGFGIGTTTTKPTATETEIAETTQTNARAEVNIDTINTNRTKITTTPVPEAAEPRIARLDANKTKNITNEKLQGVSKEVEPLKYVQRDHKLQQQQQQQKQLLLTKKNKINVEEKGRNGSSRVKNGWMANEINVSNNRQQIPQQNQKQTQVTTPTAATMPGVKTMTARITNTATMPAAVIVQLVDEVNGDEEEALVRRNGAKIVDKSKQTTTKTAKIATATTPAEAAVNGLATINANTANITQEKLAIQETNQINGELAKREVQQQLKQQQPTPHTCINDQHLQLLFHSLAPPPPTSGTLLSMLTKVQDVMTNNQPESSSLPAVATAKATTITIPPTTINNISVRNSYNDDNTTNMATPLNDEPDEEAPFVVRHNSQLNSDEDLPSLTTTSTTTTAATATISSKVILGHSTSDHTMATFPFISDTESHHPTLQLSFQNLNVLHNERQILADVSGLVSPGEVLAVMGPSGSGKTTLLDCLSGQRRIDGGSVYLNREPLSKKWRRKICYVLQEEIFFSGLTLRETVMYTALLRLPEKTPKAEKIKLVDRILEALELTFCQHTKFGDYLNRGLSGGEKKRANIACELLTNPLLMLLDEPTSGLDSHSAISLMKFLKRHAVQEQKTVVITVHQPSSQMFHMFDKLLLLYNGRTAYFGEVNNIYTHFESIGVAIKPHYNPADFVLEQLKSYPKIREKLFIAAKESHGNYLNRNSITVTTNNQRNQELHSNTQHALHLRHSNGNLHNGDTMVNTMTTLNIPTAPPTHTTATTTELVHEKSSLKRDALINDILNNYYKDIQNNHNHLNHDAMLIISDHTSSNEEEASQQLWYNHDSQSNSSATSSDCHHHHHHNDHHHRYESCGDTDWLDYPTSFHTQFCVLSSRNFKEAKPRMLSKLNWFQTFGLALMAGSIWFRIPRTEEFLHDLQGWMFFSQTYWMLFALFGALNSFPAEREVISKERRSGAYRLSAYYLAKMCGELPLVMTLPTVYLMISYPMLGCTSFKLFSLMLVFLLLNTIVAQSVGFFIGACCMDMNVSITLSALYTLATQLFGGYLSTRIPEGLSWIRYTSMIHYAYQNMQILEFREGPAIRCGNPSSFEICKNNDTTTMFIPYEEILKAQNSTSPLWLNTFVLMMFFMVFRGLGYAVLRYVRCPKT